VDSSWNAWLKRLRHDLIKRLLWPARDRRDMGGKPRSGELDARLVDEEGRPTAAEALWSRLREEAPTPDHPALVAFEPALMRATTASRRGDVTGVLALEADFDRLAQDLAKENDPPCRAC
jgi:hypothetical protein